MNTAAQNETASEIRDVVASIGISFSVNLSDKHAITMQTHIPQDTDAADIDHLVDKLAGRADRMISRYGIKALEKQIEMQKAQLKRLVTDIARVDGIQIARHEAVKGSKPFKRNQMEESQREGALATKKNFEEEIARLETELAKLKEESK